MKREEELVLSDFGCSKFLVDNPIMSCQGTVSYMAPEVL